MITYGKAPVLVSQYSSIEVEEVMYYLYLPVVMQAKWHAFADVRLPPNVENLRPMIRAAMEYGAKRRGNAYRYVYLSARRGYATPDNPLNRPGWHCDGFGTDDLNYVWWEGPGTRFALQAFKGIVSDHNRSLKQFDEQVKPENVVTYPEKGLYEIDPSVVHATPVIPPPGCIRSYVKISLSDHQYNLEHNSHNYLFEYRWEMHKRDVIRNDPARAQLDYYDGK